MIWRYRFRAEGLPLSVYQPAQIFLLGAEFTKRLRNRHGGGAMRRFRRALASSHSGRSPAAPT
jgi:hypothetical protein